MTLTLWLLAGFVFFWTARFFLQLGIECRPITVGTLIGLAVFIWVPPVSFLATIIWCLMWAFGHDGPLSKYLNVTIIDPCKWRSK